MKAFYFGALPGAILLVTTWFFDVKLDQKLMGFFARNPRMEGYVIAFVVLALAMIIVAARVVLWDRSLDVKG